MFIPSQMKCIVSRANHEYKATNQRERNIWQVILDEYILDCLALASSTTWRKIYELIYEKLCSPYESGIMKAYAGCFVTRRIPLKARGTRCISFFIAVDELTGKEGSWESRLTRKIGAMKFKQIQIENTREHWRSWHASNASASALTCLSTHSV